MIAKLRQLEKHALRGGKQQRGQDLVEFALVVPILILLLFGILQIGLLVMQYNTVANAAREGARYGIIAREAPGSGNCGSADATIDTILDAACRIAAGLDANDVTVTWSKPGGVSPAFGAVNVTVSYPAEVSITPLIEAFGGTGTFNLSAGSVMQREQ